MYFPQDFYFLLNHLLLSTGLKSLNIYTCQVTRISSNCFLLQRDTMKPRQGKGDSNSSRSFLRL